MHEALLFGEDHGHDVVLSALLTRLAAEEGIKLKLRSRSVVGGHGRALHELKSFLKELRCGEASLPDLLIVALDANCRGYAERCKEIAAAVADYPGRWVPAVPDPHVERWLLLDGRAFRSILGLGCQAPDQKCDRDRYKLLLSEAVRSADIVPLLGGIEYGEDILKVMDLNRACRVDTSFAHAVRNLRAALRLMEA